MSDTYMASDLQADNRVVAVKIMKSRHGHRLVDLVFDREYRSLIRLNHPNIVRLLDGGRDEQREGDRFLVLEWVEDDLKKVIDRQASPPGWDDFFEHTGEPVFAALAQAHDAGVAHRDIKPDNILMTAEGVPKVADFGIAKLASDIAPGITVGDFGTEPFSPPKGEPASAIYSGDVYSVAVMALVVLSGIDPFVDRFRDAPRTYVEEALAAIDIPSEVETFLGLCVSEDHRTRPHDASTALTELRGIAARRREHARALGYESAPTCHLSLAPRALENALLDFDLASVEDVQAFVLKDIASDVVVAPFMNPTFQDGRSTEGHFDLLGSELRIHVQTDNSGEGFRVRRLRADAGIYLDRDRDRGWKGPLRFTFDVPADPAAAQASMAGLCREVLEHAEDQERDRKRQGPRRVLGIWRRSLNALNEIERGKEKPLEYSAARRKGRLIEFALTEAATEEVSGQLRLADLADGTLLAGEVTGVDRRNLVLRVERGDPGQLPARGKLRVDTRMSQAALRRQEVALDALEQGATARPELESLLLDPSTALAPEQAREPDWVQDKLDVPKRQAVRKAMGAMDFLVVEGPPGTGKTTFIVEVVAQELRRQPESRILVSSQTHAALDNVLERLEALGLHSGPRLLRVGRPQDERVGRDVRGLLLGAQVESWRKEAVKGGRAYLRQWAREHGISERDVEIAVRFDELAAVAEGAEGVELLRQEAEQRLDILRDLRRSGRETSNESIGEIQDRLTDLQSETTHLGLRRDELAGRLRELGAIGNIGEVKDLTPAELRERSSTAVDQNHPKFERCAELVGLLGDWHARFGRGADFDAAALVRAQVVAGTCVGLAGVPGWDAIEFDLCIIDEASKANATELLIPMTRSVRVIVVGDHRQLPPHLDEALLDADLQRQFALTEEELRETLFERLRTHLPEDCKVMLSEQHRMVPPIGGLISSCFYDGHLKSAPKAVPPWLAMAVPTPVTWYSTSHLKGRREQKLGTSRVNPTEARAVRQILGSLNFVAQAAKETLRIAVLAAYKQQSEEISRQLSEKRPTWASLEIEVSTVDAFQGREADVAIYSVTRSNIQSRLGFLAERRRLNVALSRGRYSLLIVGDDGFVRAASGENPFRDVLAHIDVSNGCGTAEANP
jgi:serine/threonine protein kinase